MEPNIEACLSSVSTAEAVDPSVIVSWNELHDEERIKNEVVPIASSINDHYSDEISYGYEFHGWKNETDDETMELFEEGEQHRRERSSKDGKSFIECKSSRRRNLSLI